MAPVGGRVNRGPGSTPGSSQMQAAHGSAGGNERGRPGSSTGPLSVRSASMMPSKAVFPKNVDLPGNAFGLDSIYNIPVQCMARPGQFNTTGQAVTMAINSYPVTQIPNKTVYQYDIVIGSGTEKRGAIMAVWESKTVLAVTGQGWIFDGNKIAWSLDNVGTKNFRVDLDAERGIQVKPGSTRAGNSFNVSIRMVNSVNLAALQAYVSGQLAFENTVLEAINFVDHLMRETPSKNLISFKRSFFERSMDGKSPLGRGIEALKGVYQSLRPAQGGKLIVNVDVSNSVFYTPKVSLVQTAVNVLGCREIDVIHKVQRVDLLGGGTREAPYMTALKRLKKLRFTVQYKNISAEQSKKTFILADWLTTGSDKTFFDWKKNKETGETVKITLAQYFKEKYKMPLDFAAMPVVQTTKRGVMFPPEVCFVDVGQRYPYKLDEIQTASMIKFAVTRPTERMATINRGLAMLKWSEDPFHINYGLKINPNMIQTQARLLAPPEVMFAGRNEKPGFSGRWRLDGKKFLTPNPKELTNWGVCVMNNIGRDRVQLPQAQDFIRTFVQTYIGHGGKVSNRNPPIMTGSQDSAQSVMGLHTLIGERCGPGAPQLMVFMLGGRNTEEYNRIKRSADCRFGVVSQCMQNAQVTRKSPQYISNVLMKVNAKLGGTTARVPGRDKAIGHFKIPTIVVGADVSHAGPGSMMSSMAAVTVSMDRYGCRYAAACESNGHRVEMITTWNLEDMLAPLFREWMSTVGQGRYPAHLIYFRDGVSEAQYQHVLAQEVRDLKHIWADMDKQDGKPSFKKLKVTVIIASKRHHIRFFPVDAKGSDKNGNPHPGTLVEKDVTHPFEYDFYLNSHSAIQGTARPTHYHVLMDDMKLSPADLQNMIYEHCYQYMRSTTPVSLFPAVYYAHLASKRAVSHELGERDANNKKREHSPLDALELSEIMKAKQQADATGKVLSQDARKKLAAYTRTEYPKLIEMFHSNGIRNSMWYI